MIKNCIDYFLIFFLLASVNLYAQVAGTPPVYNCLTDLWVKQLRGSNDPVCTQINFSNLSGVLSDTQCPDASASVEGCVTIGTQTFAGEKTIQDPFHFLSYYELGEIAEPATPSANNLRIFAVDQNGFETLQVKTSDGVVGKIMEDGFQKVKNDTLSVITEDTVVYRSGATGNVSQVAPAKADSAVTMPAFGVVVNDIAVDGFGKVQTFGAYSKFNTLAWDEGDRLFVSAATAGAVTNVAPVHPNLQQRIGSVIKKAGGNGGIIDVSPLSQRGDEDGTNQPSFTIGATEVTSMKLTPSSTAQRTFTYPDLSGDVCVYQAGSKTWGSGSPFVWTFDAGTTDPVMRFKNEAIVIGDDVAVPFPGYSRLIVAKNGGVDLEVMSAGSDGAFVDLMRSGGTLAEPTVSTGGILGGYNFFGYDGDSYEFGAAIEVLQTGDAGANFIPTDMRFGVRDTAGVFHYLLFDNSGDLEIPGEFRPGGGIVTEELINVLSAGGQVGFYSRGGNNEGGRLALVSHGNTDAYSPTTSSSTAYLGEILFRGYNTTPVIVTGARIESNITGTVGTFIPSNLRFFTSSSSSINLAMTINSAQDILAAVSYTSPIFKSTSADPADSGIFRLGNAEEICWESSPAGADNCLTVNTSEELNYNGSPVGGGGDNITVNTTEATDANFLDNIYIAYAINTASNPDDITSKFVYNAASGDHGLLANESAFAANGFVFEGATANTIETYLQVTDPTVSDKTVTFPNANSNTVIPDTGAANNFLTAISSGGVISKAQPAFSNLSGSATDGQLPSSMAGKTFTGTTVISERFDLSGDISPAQITATTNDYNPSGLSTASVLRLTTDATRHITGIVGGADGRELEIRNVGSNLIVFLNENVGSTAANRFAFIGDTGYAVMLNPNESVTFRYDSTSSRWRNVTKIITSACEISVEYPSGTDELEFCELPSAVYVSSIRCECYGTCTVVPSIKVCKGEDLGDDTCTTNILSSTESITMSCSTAGALDNSLNLPELTANQGVSLVITNNPSANVNSLRVVVEYSQ
jgi:hypothetical protein